jgi:hypothetical protein
VAPTARSPATRVPAKHRSPAAWQGLRPRLRAVDRSDGHPGRNRSALTQSFQAPLSQRWQVPAINGSQPQRRRGRRGQPWLVGAGPPGPAAGRPEDKLRSARTRPRPCRASQVLARPRDADRFADAPHPPAEVVRRAGVQRSYGRAEPLGRPSLGRSRALLAARLPITHPPKPASGLAIRESDPRCQIPTAPDRPMPRPIRRGRRRPRGRAAA